MKIIGSRGLFVEGLIVFRQVVFSRNIVVVDLQGLNRFMAGEFRHGQQVVRKQLNQLCREIMPEAVSAVINIQIFQKGSHDVPNRFRGQSAVLIIIAVADEQGDRFSLCNRSCSVSGLQPNVGAGQLVLCRPGLCRG